MAGKPIRWANDLNKILELTMGHGRFPVPLDELVLEYSRLRFPDSPVVAVEGGSLGSFEGALYPVDGGKGWAIIYNHDVSEGRRRFTIAHEFGHYLMHRNLFPDGLQCSEESVTFRDGPELEKEADTFAAYLLMPLDDCRGQVVPDAIPSLDDFGSLADRYGVSLISCIIRWLEYTERRSILVISRDEFVLWSKSSGPALKTGLYIRTRKGPPVEIPAASLARRRDLADIARDGIRHPVGVWFDEVCTEITLHSARYDQIISLLLFGRTPDRAAGNEMTETDTFDRFGSVLRTRFDD